MTKHKKLLEAVCSNPKSVRFEEACKVAGYLGFVHQSGKGSHRVFKKKGELVQLNFQNCQGYIPPYQARQLIAMIRKYGGNP